MVSPGLPCGRQKIFLFNLKEWGGAEKDCATSAQLMAIRAGENHQQSWGKIVLQNEWIPDTTYL